MIDKIIFFRLLFGLLQCLIMGWITRAIHRHKGREGGFLWGYGLGVIGIIIAACRRNLNEEYARKNVKYAQMAKDKDLYHDGDVNQTAYLSSVRSNSWKCACGRENAAYVTTCCCGQTKKSQKG